MQKHYLLVLAFIFGCSPSWEEAPYEVYWVDGAKKLGYRVSDGAYISRIDEPVNIETNQDFISVYACPKNVCNYFYIDKVNDHKFADHDEFVFGPYTKRQFSKVAESMGLPKLAKD
ncbi:hypothetical protein [Thalassotalea sp. Y01]|uniref:hypothetical protein n=1 Tax=Thalassotalea sp. Y01 TaxID=2729613 RepID=UPI00145EF493|nr:hypothetical protein [Thalassotalea sp. Y01]NMP16415.1 hypothetical protein [Thalassotalea sp. Y01]